MGDGGWESDWVDGWRVGDMHHELWRLGWSISLFFVCLCFEGWEVAFALRWRRGGGYLLNTHIAVISTHLLLLIIVAVIVVVHRTKYMDKVTRCWQRYTGVMDMITGHRC